VSSFRFFRSLEPIETPFLVYRSEKALHFVAAAMAIWRQHELAGRARQYLQLANHKAMNSQNYISGT
jgi:hypothetical protein